MTKIDVTPEAIAKRRAAGMGPEGDKGRLLENCIQAGGLIVSLAFFGAIACLLGGCALLLIM